jgi:hypothetical protein
MNVGSEVEGSDDDCAEEVVVEVVRLARSEGSPERADEVAAAVGIVEEWRRTLMSQPTVGTGARRGSLLHRMCTRLVLP